VPIYDCDYPTMFICLLSIQVLYFIYLLAPSTGNNTSPKKISEV